MLQSRLLALLPAHSSGSGGSGSSRKQVTTTLYRRFASSSWSRLLFASSVSTTSRRPPRFVKSSASARNLLASRAWISTAPDPEAKRHAKHNPEFHMPPVKLTILGSSSMQPQVHRNATSAALKMTNNVWLFDCGEGTQRQIFTSSEIGIGMVSKIFITHLHSDHVLGLPGLLCSLRGHIKHYSDYVEIFGPPGLRHFLRQTLQATYNATTVNFVVHELWGWHSSDLTPGTTHDAKGRKQLRPGSTLTQSTNKQGQKRNHLQGLNIYPTRVQTSDDENDRVIMGGKKWQTTSQAQDYYWELPFSDDSPEASKFSVIAAPILHAVPCVGYIITEKDSPGKIVLPKRIRKRLDDPANIDFCHARGIDTPWSLLRQLKEGHVVELADGKIEPKDVLVNPVQGRRITILGDTSNPLPVARHAVGSDLIVHEATNCVATFPTTGRKGQSHTVNSMNTGSGSSGAARQKGRPKQSRRMTLKDVGPLLEPPPPRRPSPRVERIRRAKLAEQARAEAAERLRNVQNGHSTPDMAGQFAEDIGAKTLVLTHFSPSFASIPERMQMVKAHAESTFSGKVVMADDFRTINIPIPNSGRKPLDRSPAAAEEALRRSRKSMEANEYSRWFTKSFVDEKAR